jgi:hypothetical protein
MVAVLLSKGKDDGLVILVHAVSVEKGFNPIVMI